MHHARFLKRAASLGLALLLLVGTAPSHAFATEETDKHPREIVGDQVVYVSLEGELQIEGSKKTKDNTQFTFILEPYTNNDPVPTECEETIQGAGEFEFDEIMFTTPGIHRYTVVEEEGNADGYVYDDTVYHITLTVYWENKKLSASYVVREGEETAKNDDILFINTYSDEPEEEEPETSPGVSPGPGVSPSPSPSQNPEVSPEPSQDVEPNPEVSPEPSQDVEPNPEVSPEPSQDVEPNPEESPKPSEEVEPSPSQSTNPTETVTPTTSTKPTTTTTTTTTSTGSTPKTGDETNNTVWYLLLGIVAVGLIGCIGYLRASRKHSR
jgi:pilin isopeptide linkage protein